MRNAGLEEAQAGIKIAGRFTCIPHPSKVTSLQLIKINEKKKIARRNINNLRYADDTTLMVESEEELKILLMKVKEESENVGLKFNIQKLR